MSIIDLNKVIDVWVRENIKEWTSGEQKELARMMVGHMTREDRFELLVHVARSLKEVG
jgi:hypothetical protein